jgi:hypothetical protein
MWTIMQFDNKTKQQKISLRRRMLREVEHPVVMETHGGAGVLWRECYSHIADGVVFEKDPSKTKRLAQQRPDWAVYEGECENALLHGVGAHLPINFLDLDPYGEPWTAMDAFFESERPRPERMIVVVNDGLRQKIQYGGAWSTGSMEAMVQTYGNDLYDVYLEVCLELVKEKAAKAGYALDRFTGYYCGYNGQMTHYGAVLTRGPTAHD